jgi:thymidylate synthase (FAD)
MKIIDQHHEIIHITPALLEHIEAAARTCYKSGDRIKTGSAEAFVAMIMRCGHHAMLEFGDITVRFVTNRGVTHELVRHRLCSFAQESTRYVRYNGAMEVIRPVWWHDSTWDHQACWEAALSGAETAYEDLLRQGWRPEQARDVLPNALKTEIVVNGNIREWRHILTLRTSPQAHPQIRVLMAGLLADLKQRVAVVFDDILSGTESDFGTTNEGNQ